MLPKSSRGITGLLSVSAGTDPPKVYKRWLGRAGGPMPAEPTLGLTTQTCPATVAVRLDYSSFWPCRTGLSGDTRENEVVVSVCCCWYHDTRFSQEHLIALPAAEQSNTVKQRGSEKNTGLRPLGPQSDDGDDQGLKQQAACAAARKPPARWRPTCSPAEIRRTGSRDVGVPRAELNSAEQVLCSLHTCRGGQTAVSLHRASHGRRDFALTGTTCVDACAGARQAAKNKHDSTIKKHAAATPYKPPTHCAEHLHVLSICMY